MSKETTDIKKLTPEEQLRELVSTNRFAKRAMQQILSLIDKSANIDDEKFKQELSKAKDLAYQKGARIDYNPLDGFRDLSVVTTVGKKVDKKEFKKVSIEDIKNIIETAPDKKPSYYKQDEQEKGAVTNHEAVDRHSDETFLSSSSINKAKELLKTQPTKSILKVKTQVDSIENLKPTKSILKPEKPLDSIDNPRAKKTVSFGDDNGVKIDVRGTKSQYNANTPIDYKTLDIGNEVTHTTNLANKLEFFVDRVIQNKNLRKEVENILMEYASATGNDNVIKNTASALVKWNVISYKSLTDFHEPIVTKMNNKVKNEVGLYRKSIEKDLTTKGVSKIVIKDVLNEFDKSITQPIELSNPKKANLDLAQEGFSKFGSQIGTTAREEETRTVKQAQKKDGTIKGIIVDTKQLQPENDIGGRVSELQADNKKIEAELQDIAKSKAPKRFERFNIPLIRKEKNLEKEKLQNDELFQRVDNLNKQKLQNLQLIKEYKEIVQPTISRQVKENEHTFYKMHDPKFSKAVEKTFTEKEIAKLVQAKIDQIKALPMRQDIQSQINDLVRIPQASNRTTNLSIGQRGATPIIEERPNKGQAKDRSSIPKSTLAKKQASQGSKQIRELRRSVELPNNNIASPALNKSSSLPNINSQSTQKPFFAPKYIPNPQVNAASNAIRTSTKQETVLQTQKNASIDALWAKLANRKNTQFLTDGTTQDSPSANKMKAIRENIGTYKDNIQINNLNSSFKLGPVDENYKNITPKDTKIIELTSKALAEINNGTIEKVDNYLKRIDDIDRGLLKTAVIGANDHILQPLAQKTATKVQELQSERNTNQNKTTIEKAKNIGISMASLINEHAVQKIATSAQAKVNNYRNKKQERGGRS